MNPADVKEHWRHDWGNATDGSSYTEVIEDKALRYLELLILCRPYIAGTDSLTLWNEVTREINAVNSV